MGAKDWMLVYAAGEIGPVLQSAPDGDDPPYPFVFHPLELAEAALRVLFGFNYEGLCLDDDPDLERIILAGFTVQPTADC